MKSGKASMPRMLAPRRRSLTRSGQSLIEGSFRERNVMEEVLPDIGCVLRRSCDSVARYVLTLNRLWLYGVKNGVALKPA